MTRAQFQALAEALRELKKDLHKASADGCDNAIALALHAHQRRIEVLCGNASKTFDLYKFRDAVEG